MPLLPPAEAVLVAYLAAKFPQARVVTELPSSLGDHVPLLEVDRIGGPDNEAGADEALVDVTSYHSTRILAAQFAEDVRYALRWDLPGRIFAGGYVSACTTQQPPVWRPFDVTEVRRYQATYRPVITATP